MHKYVDLCPVLDQTFQCFTKLKWRPKGPVLDFLNFVELFFGISLTETNQQIVAVLRAKKASLMFLALSKLKKKL